MTPATTPAASLNPTPRRPDVRGVEAYTRWSLLLISAGEIAVVGLVLVGLEIGDAVGWVLAVTLLHTVCAVRALDVGMRAQAHEGPGAVRTAWRRAVVVLGIATVLTLAVLAVVVPVFGGDPDGALRYGRASLMSLVGGFTVAVLAARWRPRWLALTTAILVGLVVLAHVGRTDELGTVAIVAVVYGIAMSAFAISYRISIWILEVVRELEDARRNDALLAVADERLRIARDIHDVVGRALSVVAVKSDLAATLQRRGDPRAEQEMLGVRQIAQESLAQVRAVVAGYRETDLPTELAGASSVLGSAGVATTVTGTTDGLDDRQRAVLGAVVREAVTNVVRHSDATWCTFALARDGLIVRNDGVRDRAVAGAGGTGDGVPSSGLTGLRERLDAVGGRLEVARTGEVFEVRALLTDTAHAAEKEGSR